MSERRSRGGAAIFSTTKRIVILGVLVILIFAVLFAKNVLKSKQSEYSNKISEIENLEVAIQDEEDKSSKLKKNEGHVLDNEDMESIARAELGLIKRDEIIIKPN